MSELVQQDLFDFAEKSSGSTPEPTRREPKRRLLPDDIVDIDWPIDACGGDGPENMRKVRFVYKGKLLDQHSLVPLSVDDIIRYGPILFVSTLEHVHFFRRPSEDQKEKSPFDVSHYTERMPGDKQ